MHKQLSSSDFDEIVQTMRTAECVSRHGVLRRALDQCLGDGQSDRVKRIFIDGIVNREEA